MDIIWTRQALSTLESIADYIAEDNPIAAYDVTEAIRQAVEPLANFPEMGRRGRIAGTREWPVSRLPYLIIYRIRGNAVEILEVFHTSRRFPPEL
jgi:addiction module RelE/StbE family toxin